MGYRPFTSFIIIRKEEGEEREKGKIKYVEATAFKSFKKPDIQYAE